VGSVRVLGVRPEQAELCDVTLADFGIDCGGALDLWSAPLDEFGDRAPWSAFPRRSVDLVMPAAVSIDANFGAGGHGGL
jgi:hypothetical protein